MYFEIDSMEYSRVYSFILSLHAYSIQQYKSKIDE